MKCDVHVAIPVDQATAEVLRSPAHREIIGELVIRMVRPWDGDDPLSGLLEGELLLRQEAGRAVTGLTAGDAEWIKGRSRKTMSPDEMLASSTTPVTVADIVAQAERVWGNASAARQWLFRPNMMLGRQRPIDLLATNEGALAVANTIGRIEAGVCV
jgi:uncharacterized protein (DUF2384 family)